MSEEDSLEKPFVKLDEETKDDEGRVWCDRMLIAPCIISVLLLVALALDLIIMAIFARDPGRDNVMKTLPGLIMCDLVWGGSCLFGTMIVLADGTPPSKNLVIPISIAAHGCTLLLVLFVLFHP